MKKLKRRLINEKKHLFQWLNGEEDIKPKYVDWFINQIEKEIDKREKDKKLYPYKRVQENVIETIIQFYIKDLKEFDLLCEDNKIRDKRDINSYKDINELRDKIVNTQIENNHKKAKKKDKKEGIKVHLWYEDEQFLIIEPLSVLAAIKYGKGTKWCTSSEKYEGSLYGHKFMEFMDGGLRVIYVIEKRDNGKKSALLMGRESYIIYSECDLKYIDEYDNYFEEYSKEVVKGLCKIIEDRIPNEVKDKWGRSY